MQTPGINEDWNQPRCWSEPSKYRSAGTPPSSFLFFNTAWLLTPESNQTSRISEPLENVFPLPHNGQVNPSGRKSFISLLNQASVPSFATNWENFSMIRGSKNSSLHSRQTKAGTGTPQYLCRERHQSGRSFTIAEILSFPAAGTHFTSCSIALISFPLKPSLSMDKNHCLVARKIIGFLQRQQCG